MNRILVIGAGLSSSSLIRYLAKEGTKHQWQLTVADQSEALATQRIKGYKNAQAVSLDTRDKKQRGALISAHDLVVSLMPPALHVLIARDCIKLKKHLVTASYISPEMKKLHRPAIQANVLLLNECGLDPGIDHLSAMQLIDGIRAKGGSISSFKSYCGGLVAPEYDNNPWNYKFTWNPRNVVLAGNSAATYTTGGKTAFIPANRIFLQTEPVSVKGYGQFEAYANRDSNNYIQPYGLTSAAEVVRGTLRRKGYCKSWNNLVRTGLTDDTLVLNKEIKTWRQLITSLLPPGNPNPEQGVCTLLGIGKQSTEFKKLQWLGLFEEIPVQGNTPAEALQQLLMQKWKLQKGELDMIVMQHRITYDLNGKKKKTTSSLVVKGENEVFTAMAKTVGLPMGIAVKLIMRQKIKARGVQMPLSTEFYVPILKELEKHGICFREE